MSDGVIMEFVKTQNLPQNDVCLVAISQIATKQINALNSIGIKTIEVPPCPYIQNGVSTHPDMVMFHSGGREILLHNYSKDLNENLLKSGFNLSFTDVLPSEDYPNDIALNSFLLGENFVGSEKFSKEIAFKKLDKNPIPTKQGYAKCSSVILSENAVITSDIGIHKALVGIGVDSIHVTTNGIALDEYSCGFIGGTCGKIGASTLAFTGSLKYYPDGDKVKQFCEKHGISVLSLCDEPLCDVGSIIPLMQK